MPSGSRNDSPFYHDRWSSDQSRQSPTIDPRLLSIGASPQHPARGPPGSSHDSGYSTDAGRPSFSSTARGGRSLFTSHGRATSRAVSPLQRSVPSTSQPTETSRRCLRDRSNSSSQSSTPRAASPQTTFREMDWSPSEGREILNSAGVTTPALYSFSVRSRRSTVGDNILDYGRDSVNRSRVGESARPRRDALTGSIDVNAPGYMSPVRRSSADVRDDMDFLSAHEPRRASLRTISRASNSANESRRSSSRTYSRAANPAQTSRERSSSWSGSIWREWVDLDA